jgi:hypothetical protein
MAQFYLTVSELQHSAALCVSTSTSEDHTAYTFRVKVSEVAGSITVGRKKSCNGGQECLIRASGNKAWERPTATVDSESGTP